MAWNAQSLQAVWFTPGLTAPPPVDDVFRAVTGNVPTSTNSVGGVSNASATDGQNVLRVQTQSGRVDFIETFQSFPVLPDLATVMPKFSQMIDAGTGILGDVYRLALVVNISEKTNTPQEAIDLILPKLNLTLPFMGGDEFIFQINRRAPLRSVQNCEINRILKWLVQTFQHLQLTVGASPTYQSLYFATLSIDLNTVSSGQTFKPTEQKLIFHEMADEVERLYQSNTVAALS